MEGSRTAIRTISRTKLTFNRFDPDVSWSALIKIGGQWLDLGNSFIETVMTFYHSYMTYCCQTCVYSCRIVIKIGAFAIKIAGNVDRRLEWLSSPWLQIFAFWPPNFNTVTSSFPSYRTPKSWPSNIFGHFSMVGTMQNGTSLPEKVNHSPTIGPACGISLYSKSSRPRFNPHSNNAPGSLSGLSTPHIQVSGLISHAKAGLIGG